MKATCANMEGHTEAFIYINVLFPKQGRGFTGVYYISPYTFCTYEICHKF